MNTKRSRTAPDDFARARRAAKVLLGKTRLRPRVAVVLGSGLGDFAEGLEGAKRIPYAKIPGFPRSSVVGHAGRMVIGHSGKVPVAVMQGRVHFYEGFGIREVVFPVRVLALLGVRAIVFTNAAGGIDPSYGQGALVALRDHINLQGTNPLIGANERRFGPRFPDMTEAYSKAFRAAAIEEARQLGFTLHEGVYAAMHGPSYETPAEIRALQICGADAVGMSTAREVQTAHALGIECAGLSCITNAGAGLSSQPLSHGEVLATAAGQTRRLAQLVESFLMSE